MSGDMADRQAPYAPGSNVLTIIRRLRERGLPDPLTLGELERLGIPTGNTSRTLAAMRFLGLVTDDGGHTDQLDRLRRANMAEYPQLLAEILQGTYAPVFQIVDPASATGPQLHDAFRTYNPQAQRERMVALFVALCREAGLMAGAPREPQTRAKKKMEQKRPQRERRQPESQREEVRAYSSSVPSSVEPRGRYQVLHDLVDQLPTDGRWTKERRDLWMSAVQANVAFLVQIYEPDTQPISEMLFGVGAQAKGKGEHS